MCSFKADNISSEELQDEARFTELLMMQEEIKTLPFGDVWEEYCRREGVGGNWFAEIKKYEQEVLFKR